jgi:MYXO-CTERM domain-containing protein
MIEARARGVVAETDVGWLVAAPSLVALIERDAPRAMQLEARGRTITVTRNAVGPAELHVADDLITLRSRDAVESLVFATTHGVEELVVANDDVRYRVDLPAGLRLRVPVGRQDAVEVVDWRGAAHLRMVAPRAWDERGNAHPIEVHVDGSDIRISVPEVDGPLLVDPEWQPTDPPLPGRHCLAPVVMNDGKVLLTGLSEPGASVAAEIFDPVSRSFTLGADTTADRCFHSTTLLRDGRVLIVGGIGNGVRGVQGSVEVYDPATGLFSQVESGPPRQLHTATRLHNGTVLIVGGYEPFTGPNSWDDDLGEQTALDAVQIFHPGDNTLSDEVPLPTAVGNHRATLLADGSVLVSGGADGSVLSSELLRRDPASGQWIPVGNMSEARQGHAALLLPQQGTLGQLLLVGGDTRDLVDVATWQVTPDVGAGGVGNVPGVDTVRSMRPVDGDPLLLLGAFHPSLLFDIVRFDTQSSAFQSEPGGPSAVDPTNTVDMGATVLANGDPFVVSEGFAALFPHSNPQQIDIGASGSIGSVPDAALPLSTGEVLVFATGLGPVRPVMEVYLFDPAVPGASPVPGLLDAIGDGFTATPLTDGRVLIAGGESTNPPVIFNPKDSSLEQVGRLTESRRDHAAVLMPDGSVLLVGGIRADGTPVSGAERYDADNKTFTALDIEITGGTEAFIGSDGRVWVFGRCAEGCIQVYDPIGGTTETIAGVGSEHVFVTPLFDGRWLMGTREASSGDTDLSFVDPASATITPTTVLSGLDAGEAPLLLPSGRVLIATGSGTAWLVDATGGTAEDLGTFGLNGGPPVMTLMADGGVLLIQAEDGVPMPQMAFAIWYESLPPEPSWRPQLGQLPSGGVAFPDSVPLTGSNLLGLAEPTDGTSSGRTNHPVAVFMPFGGTPTIGGFADWTATTLRYAPPIPAQTGPGYLFAAVAGQLNATYANLIASDNGAPCISAAGCLSNICFDDVCCERICDACEACAAALKTDGDGGTCGPALVDTDKRGDCEAMDAFTCEQTGVCDGAGECAVYPEETPCSNGICIGGDCVDRCFSNLHCPEGEQCGPDGFCEPKLEQAEPLGCAPCSSAGSPNSASGWWWLIAGALLGRRRRGCAGRPLHRERRRRRGKCHP